MLGAMMLDIAGTALDESDKQVLIQPQVGGVILFSRNYESPEQVSALCAEIHALRTPPLLIAVDQEGGIVQRFRHGFSRLPSMASLGKLYDQDTASALKLTEDVGWLLAAELRTVGVDFSFAPVLDLELGLSSVIDSRAFHAKPSVVASLAQALMRGMNAAGMNAVGKHFPGHGSVVADSHHQLPVDERDWTDISQRDLRPFKIVIEAGIPALMPAHILFPKIDQHVVGFSRHWLQTVLRQQLGFQGAIFSDDLSMQGAAVAGSIEERATAALAAGCDMLLVCNDRAAALKVLHCLVDYENPAAQARFLRLHGWSPDKQIITPAQLSQHPRLSEIRAALAPFTRMATLNLKDDMMN